jgi:hypothetical protein
MKIKVGVAVCLLAICCLFGCQKNNIDCKNAFTINTVSNAGHPCIPNGSITISAPIGTSYIYQLDKQAFQQLPIFSQVKAGPHNILVKDDNGCIAESVITVDSIQQGAKFKAVFEILANRCGTCHSGNNPHAGLNFTYICDVLNHWDRIAARAIQGIPSPMPQAGLIPIAERQKIVDWINAGHVYDL